MKNSRCPHCDGPLIEINHYGERLTGCAYRWRQPEDPTLPPQLHGDRPSADCYRAGEGLG
jgi:hypothetical protein